MHIIYTKVIHVSMFPDVIVKIGLIELPLDAQRLQK